ncbi:hypothetical protein [Streptomyces sp. NPDC058694]|uniref:hypothetical protein n=1 Tax=Streptomyces sp. NPDC058694 TaxID=3346603 RepID=UPI00364D8685
MALLLGSTGCGTKVDKNPSGAQAPDSTTQGKKPTTRVLTQDQLERAVVNQHDLPGLSIDRIGVGTEGVGDGVVKPFSTDGTQPAKCAPVGAVLEGGSGYTPVGSVMRIAKSREGAATLYLVSYREAQAVRAIEDLRTALRTCTAFTAGPMKAAYTEVRTTDDPSQGDDGLSFRLTQLMEGPGEDDPLKVPETLIAIRSGSAIAVFTAVPDGTHTVPKLPTDLVNAQSKALSAATRTTS